MHYPNCKGALPDYKSNTLDKYLREMKFLQSSQVIINKMAGFWYHLWEDKPMGR
jgi:hypothetical protein